MWSLRNFFTGRGKVRRLIKINQEMSESNCKIAFSTVENERSALTRVIYKPNFIKLIIHYSPIISRSIDKKIINIQT